MNNILECVGLSKSYAENSSKIDILQQINFSVKSAELVAIVGVSGSGKSTFLHLLGGLDKPTSGKVTLLGYDLATLSENMKCELRNKHLGFVYQFHHLLPEFTALENVSMPLLIRGNIATNVIREKASHILEKVGLKDRMQHKSGELSGGERQRVAIARALVANPDCILADEPTGNLDPRNAEKVLELFFDLQKTFQTSVVMVTHDAQIAKRAQRILMIEEGRLIESGH
ncbi:lipoprotein ABC transporter ATP-binding protein [Gammaproteobacteria bacterium SCGC AG-212-F23]|nr:lipoprotein ABC transporter ATP-binding protein [Gammaproteobacteria bacterium SCGC AG-212-F23]